MTLPTLGLVGLGKIARDQHIPAIAATGLFELAAVVSPDGAGPKNAQFDGVPTYHSQAEMLAALPALDAVALCTPPSVRHALTVEALRAGKHVLIEKPPSATVSELGDLIGEATRAERTLFAAWHSRFNPAVEEARRRLASAGLKRAAIAWKEDVRRWHPGQDWIFAAGGFGVFDPGINALSILTHILPEPVFVTGADLQVPANRDTPIVATLAMRSGQTPVSAEFDFLQLGEQTWAITLETGDGARLELTRGGARLAVDGQTVVEEPDTEYQRIYRHFHGLIAEGTSDVDARPLHLVADACLAGRWRSADPFHW